MVGVRIVQPDAQRRTASARSELPGLPGLPGLRRYADRTLAAINSFRCKYSIWMAVRVARALASCARAVGMSCGLARVSGRGIA